MKPRQLEEIGVPSFCHGVVQTCLRNAAEAGVIRTFNVKQRIAEIMAIPDQHVNCPHFGPFAQALIEERDFIATDPIEYSTWGGENIDPNAHEQMKTACGLPVVRAAALMGDAHLGYAVPIGAVIALDNAVMPGAVGVDIACRMKLSVLDMPPESLSKQFNLFKESLQKGTSFGVGAAWQHKKNHPVMDEDWSITRVTQESKDKAWSQLGTSGSGNHFVEFGLLTLPQDSLGLQAGQYVALLSHSGSRGTGAKVCDQYARIAAMQLHRRYADMRGLGWLSMDSEAGQEYWLAMNLMGNYAAANHDVIHKSVSKLLGAKIITGVENNHNFAWHENHGGKDVYVHRKGATPAGEGVLGIIPGSMGTPGFVVRGKGNPKSLMSASHGAGRCMSRRAANEKYTWNAVKKDLEAKGIVVLSAGADEVPFAYKDIHAIMAAQQDLVEVIGQFDPKIVKMSDDGKSED